MSQTPRPVVPAGMPSSAISRTITPSIPPSTPRGTPAPAPGPLRKSGSIHFTEDTENFMVGDRVWVNGTKGGKIQFIGETKFAAGEWAGVVLDDVSGKNDGSVNGVRYFQCEASRGVFVRLHRLSRVPLSKEEIEAVKNARMSAAGSLASLASLASNEFAPAPEKRINHITEANKSTEPTTHQDVGAMTPDAAGFKVGQRVFLAGDRSGIIRFLGSTHFQGGIWAGVELDEGKGKNDGSVDGQRYFTCSANHGVFAAIAKLSKVPLPAGSSQPSSYNTPTRLKRSPSQESMVSNFSVQSTMSRRSAAVRPGMTPYSPSTLLVSRTGTGTPAEIHKAHQEKDNVITTLTKERDFARKELEAKSSQERDVHSEIQKLQEQYMGALSAQEERISELEENVRRLEEEKNRLREMHEEERRRVEDLQFRLEEEEMAKEAGTDDDLIKRVLEEKNREISALKSQIDNSNAQTDSLKNTLLQREEEVDRWRSAADGTKFQTAEIADDRDRIAFEVADLSRQLRDLTEKSRIDMHALQENLQEKIVNENNLKNEIDKYHNEVERLRFELAEASIQNERGGEELVTELRRENDQHRQRAEEANQFLTKSLSEAEQLRLHANQVQQQLEERGRALKEVLRQYSHGLPEPQSFEEEIPAILQIFTKIRDEAAEKSGMLEEQMQSLRSAHDQSQSTIQDLQRSLTAIQSSADSNNKDDPEVNRIRVNLDDKMKEIETCQYQITELSIEISGLKNENQELLDRSHSELTNATNLHKDELARTHRTHSLDVENLKRSFEAHANTLEKKLANISDELEAAESEKAQLNKEIGRFIEVLKGKDADLKAAREQIEKHFVRERDEKAQLSDQVNDQKEKIDGLKNEVKSLTVAFAERSKELEDFRAGASQKDRDVGDTRSKLSQAEARCQSLFNELEQAKAAFGQQMMKVEMRRDEQVQALTAERDALSTTSKQLQERIAVLSATTAAEVDSLRDQLSRKLEEANAQLTVKNIEVDALRKETQDMRNKLDTSRKEHSEAASNVAVLQDKVDAVNQRREELTNEKMALDEKLAEVKEKYQTIQEEYQKLRTDSDEMSKNANGLKFRMEAAELRISTLSSELETANAAFAEQITLAQLRLEDQNNAHAHERQILTARVAELEDQVASLVADNASRLSAVRDELHHKISSMEAESIINLHKFEESSKEVAQLRDQLQHVEIAKNKLLEVYQRTLDEHRRLTEENSVAQERLKDLQSLPQKLSQLENEFTKQNSTFSLTQTECSQLRSQLTSTKQSESTLRDALATLHKTVLDLESQQRQLTDQNSSLLRRVKTTESGLKREVEGLKAELNDNVERRAALQNELDVKSVQLEKEMDRCKGLEREVDGLKVERNQLMAQVASESQMDMDMSTDRRTLDKLLSKELEKVKSDVEQHRHLVQQKDSQISKMKLETMHLIEEKDSELALMKDKILQSEAQFRREKIQKLAVASSTTSHSNVDKSEFQIQILNSVIADQQNKILDLQTKLTQSSLKFPGPPPSVSELTNKDSGDSVSIVKRRPIRLYCGACEVFDLHDTLACPKRNQKSPERERKPKTTRARRKYCDECEVFDQHESAECPTLLTKSSHRVPLRPTGIPLTEPDTF